MEQKIALVTGASRGIGAATARALALAGYHVVATARTEGGLTELDDAIRAEGGTATLLPLDLLDGAGLDMIGPSIFDRFGRLDAMVHSAGALGRLTPVPHILPADWNAVVGVNFAAAWRLIRSCAPVLQAAPAGRAVFLTTQRAGEPRAYWGAYGATKAALDHLVLTWAHETVTTTVLRVNLVDPGPVAGRLRTEAFPGEDPATLLAKPADVAPAIAALCAPTETRHGQIICLGRLDPAAQAHLAGPVDPTAGTTRADHAATRLAGSSARSNRPEANRPALPPVADSATLGTGACATVISGLETGSTSIRAHREPSL